jgi:hypothetical protein
MNELENAIFNGTNATRNVESNESYFDSNQTQFETTFISKKTYHYKVKVTTEDDEILLIPRYKVVFYLSINPKDLDQYQTGDKFDQDFSKFKKSNIYTYFHTNPIVFETNQKVIESPNSNQLSNYTNLLISKNLKVIAGQEVINQILNYLLKKADLDIDIPITIITNFINV